MNSKETLIHFVSPLIYFFVWSQARAFSEITLLHAQEILLAVLRENMGFWDGTRCSHVQGEFPTQSTIPLDQFTNTFFIRTFQQQISKGSWTSTLINLAGKAILLRPSVIGVKLGARVALGVGPEVIAL